MVELKCTVSRLNFFFNIISLSQVWNNYLCLLNIRQDFSARLTLLYL